MFERRELDVLRFFSDNPGWRIELDGSHLALWRSQRPTEAVT
jgi:hypothetical protein